MCKYISKVKNTKIDLVKGKDVKRNGFSLVELVLSIVVIAIALMTVPLMLNQSSKSNQFALMQESILAARTKMGNVLSFKWDHNASDLNGSVVRVLDVTDGAAALDRITYSDENRRKGHVKEDRRRRMTDNEMNASLGLEGTDFDDIDDFHNESSIVAPAGGGVKGKFDYLDEDLNLTVTVKYISDDINYSEQNLTFDFNVSSATFAAGESTNIKMIELRATSVNNDIPFLFRTFSCNIGQSKLYERVK